MRLRGSHRATPVCLIPSGNRSSLSFPKISTYHPIYFPLSSDATGERQRMLGARRRRRSESSRGGAIERGPLLPETRRLVVVPSTARGVAGGRASRGLPPAWGSSASSTRAAVGAPSGKLRAAVGASCSAVIGSFVCTSFSVDPRRFSGGELHRRPGVDERNRRGLLVARHGPAEPCCGDGASLVAVRRGSATDALFSMLQ
jgi:hypothetical protein